LGAIISTSDVISSTVDSSPPPPQTTAQGKYANSIRLNPSMSLSGASSLSISIQSGGYCDGNFAFMDIQRDNVSITPISSFGRGLNVIVFDSIDGSILESATFDSHISAEESEDFSKMIESLEIGSIVAIAAKVRNESMIKFLELSLIKLSLG
jgi:hypothetical protein